MILIALAILSIVFALCAGFRARRYATTGRAYVFTDASGRGLAGVAERAASPIWFWSVLIMHILSSSAGLLIGGLLILKAFG